MLIRRRSLLAALGAAPLTWFVSNGFAKPGRGHRKPAPSPTPTGGGGGGQCAVALTPASSETISGGVQSNFAGNGFYTRKGLTYARDWTGPNPLGGSFSGFDDPNFLPISTWLTDYQSMSAATAYARMDDLGLNGMFPCSGAISLDDAITYGKWCTVLQPEFGAISTAHDPAVVGIVTGDEPNSIENFHEIVADAATYMATADGPGRFHHLNFTHPLINGSYGFGVINPPDMVTASPMQFTTCDEYWHAGARSGIGAQLHQNLYDWAWDPEGAASEAQCARGSNYGSMMDSIRKNYPAGNAAPCQVWIEAAAPFGESTSLAMTPSMLKWAVWSTLVHGARGISYFVHNFRTGDTWGHAFWDDHFGGPGVAGTGIYAAAKEVNLNALSIASAINAPFDGYFVYGDTADKGLIETTGFLTAVKSTNSRWRYGGIDASCRWLPTESRHYILATTREVNGSTNWPVTFRMVDQGQTTAVRLFDTSGSISISRGGAIPAGYCEFSDTFSTAASYKAYRID